MNENINLCEILKGHEGETFYSPAYGHVCLSTVIQGGPIIVSAPGYSSISMKPNGTLPFSTGECMLFPSKDQRDWNKWVEKQKPKVPKIWNEMTSKYCNVEVWQHISHMDYGSTEPIVKSAVALLKIHQLIEAGYGRNISIEEWNNPTILKYIVICRGNNINEDEYKLQKEAVAFHTAEQRKEFLSCPENVQLLKDYFMI